MKYINRPLARAAVVVCATLAMVSGVTYAALVSQPSVIQNNSITTANANLRISSNGSPYANTIDGFSFGNIVPGGQASPNSPYSISLRNDGTSPLDMRLSVGSGLVNNNQVNLSKVRLLLTPFEGGATQSYTLADLIAADTSGGVPLLANFHLIPTQVQMFKLQVAMDADAVTGSSATLDKVNINFNAVAVN